MSADDDGKVRASSSPRDPAQLAAEAAMEHLDSLLREAGIELHSVLLTARLSARPEGIASGLTAVLIVDEQDQRPEKEIVHDLVVGAAMSWQAVHT